MWRLIYLNQHLKSAFTSISWSRKKKSSACKLCVHFGTSFWYKSVYIIYNTELLWKRINCKCKLCNYNLYCADIYYKLDHFISCDVNYFFKITKPRKNWPEILFYTPFLNLSAIKTCKLLTLVRPSVRFGHLKKTIHFVLKNNQQKTIPNVIQGLWHIIIFPKGFTL